MKISIKHSILSAILGLTVGLQAAGRREPEPLRIVFIAYENPDQLLENVDPVVDYLVQELGHEVRAFVATDYAGVVEALRNETADVGFMGPLQYIMAHEQAGALPLLGEIYNGKATYVAKIFVRKDSGIGKLEDLRGKSIAFVDPISSSGYMYPLNIFRDAGVFQGTPESFFRRVYFAGGDEQSIRAVYYGFVDAAGIGQYSYNLLRGQERDEVIPIAESRAIPSHCLVARKGLAAKLSKSLTAALLALNAEGEHHHLLKYLYSVDGYVEVEHETYAEVEAIAKAYGFIK